MKKGLAVSFTARPLVSLGLFSRAAKLFTGKAAKVKVIKLRRQVSTLHSTYPPYGLDLL
jgi:hypothetical protein